MAEEITRARLARSERLSLVGSFVSGLAHEIRTPLAAATNHLSVLQARLHREAAAGTLPPALADALGHVAATTDALDRIDHLVEGLRDFTRHDDAERTRLGIGEALSEALQIYEAAHRGRIELVADLAPTTPITLVKSQIEQVALRLLENAAESMPMGGTVRVATRETPLAVELIVEDHGMGILPEVQRHMFEEFYTTKPGSPGLGLAIVRRIVEGHGGTVHCRSEMGKGSTFTVSLPKR